MKTYDIIDDEINKLELKVSALKFRKANTFSESLTTKCDSCNTHNNHYNVDTGNYTCAFCGVGGHTLNTQKTN